MKKRILSFVLVLAMLIGIMPFSAFAFEYKDISTGKGDTASYYCDVPDDVSVGLPGYSAWGGSYANMSRALVEIDGETFISYYALTGNANDCTYPSSLTFAGYAIDLSVLKLSDLNYLAYRFKVTTKSSPLALSISIGWDGAVGWLNAANAVFIDNNTREVTTTKVEAKGSGYYNIQFNEDFDGWMILDLNTDFIGDYTKSATTTSHKEYFLKHHEGGIQYYVHKGCHGATESTDWSDGAAINIGDILMVENIDTFKTVRFGCANLNHVKEVKEYITEPSCENKGLAKYACKFCGIDMGTEEVPESHNYEITKVEPTETEAGYTLHTCTLCGASYKDDYVAAGTVKDNLLIGMYHFPDHPTPTLTEEEYLKLVEAVFKEGYVNTVATNGGKYFTKMLALYKKYNIKFWLYTGLYNSDNSTIASFIGGVEKTIKVIKEEGAWDLFLGFHWDEPAHNGQRGDDFLAMTKALYEKWGKRNYPVFAISTFLEKYYSQTGSDRPYELYTPEHMSYVTDAGWDIYQYDLRKEAESNANQQSSLRYESSKYGETFNTAKDYYRYVQRMLTERIGHDFNAWFYPATKYGGVSTGTPADEGFMMGQIEGFNEIMMEQKNPGGLMLYTFTTWSGQTALEERLPIRDDEGNQLLYPEVEKYTDLAELIINTRETYDNTEIYLPDDIVAGVIDVAEKTETSITLNPVHNYVYSMDGVSWIESGKFENLTVATAYTITAKKLSTGETKDFVVSTKAEVGALYSSGLKDTASYIVKIPSGLKYATPGWVGRYIGRTKDDSGWTNNYNGPVHFKEFDGERFLEIYKQAGYDDNILIKLGFGDEYRTVSSGFSEGIDASKLSGFAFRIKTTGGDESVESRFGIWINERFSNNGTYYYIDSLGNVTENSGSIKITQNIDGWIIIPFDSFATAQSGMSNREWFSKNMTGFGYYIHDENCGHGDKCAWGSRKLYLGDMMVYEDLETFKNVRYACVGDNHSYETVSTKPTCTEPGTITYTCTVCGDTYTKETKPATGHTYVDGACKDCGIAHPYYTGLGDTAVYYANVPDDVDTGLPGYNQWGGSNYLVSRDIVQINGETFVSYHSTTGNANDCAWPTRLTYSDGYIDTTIVDTSKINYWVWRIKATTKTSPLSFFVSIGNDLNPGILNASNAKFIDINSKQVSPSVTAKGSGYYHITFTDDFDGYMIVDLNTDFIAEYKPGTLNVSQKEHLLNHHNGKIQYYICNGCHDATESTDWSVGAAINIGDILLVEDIETFKAVRFGCNENGHNYVDGVCTACGKIDPDAPPVHDEESEHVWVESGRDAGTCTAYEKIHYECICGATKTENGEIDADNHSFKGGACVDCGEPFEKSYATGKNDSASYWCNLSDDVSAGMGGYSAWGAANIRSTFVEIDGETYVSYHSLTGNANDVVTPQKLTHYAGVIDPRAIDTDKINFWAWRLNVKTKTSPLSMTISIGTDLNPGMLDATKAVFIDKNTRQPVDTVITQGSGYYRITFTEDFDGWMIVNLSDGFISGDNISGSQRDYLFKDLINARAGRLQYYFHNGACHGDTVSTDWSEGAAINIGDILMVEDIEIFKSVRFSCDELGHVYENGECKFCGSEHADHAWTETGRDEATCQSAEQIYYACDICGATKTEDGAAGGHKYENGACKFCGEADPDAPAIVTKAELKVDSQTSDTISVSWNNVTGVNDYYIQITDKLTGAPVRVVRAQNTNATTIYGLTAGTEYLLSICAYTPGKPAVYEEAIDAKTSGFAPLGLTATEKGAEVELNWNKPANAVAYYCYILKDGQTIRAAGVQNPEQTTFTFMLPKEAGSYTFGIIAATFDGVKNVYWDMQTTTQPIVVAVNNPTLSVVSKTTDSLTLAWNAIGGVNDYYIQIVDKETGALVRVARAQNTTSTTIYGLSAGTDYLLSICAYTPGRPAVYSEPIEAQTESHSELNLTATQKGNEVELNWNKPANAIAYYVYILKDGETIRAAGVQNPEQTTFTFMMPIGKGSYTFGIIAATNNGAQNIYSPMQVTPDAIVVA